VSSIFIFFSCFIYAFLEKEKKIETKKYLRCLCWLVITGHSSILTVQPSSFVNILQENEILKFLKYFVNTGQSFKANTAATS